MVLLIHSLFTFALSYLTCVPQLAVNALKTEDIYNYENTQNAPTTPSWLYKFKDASTGQIWTSYRDKIEGGNNGDNRKTFGMTSLRWNKSVNRDLDATRPQASNSNMYAQSVVYFNKPAGWERNKSNVQEQQPFGQHNDHKLNNIATIGGSAIDALWHLPQMPQDSFKFSWENKLNNHGIPEHRQEDQAFRSWSADSDTARIQSYGQCLIWKGCPGEQFVSRDLNSDQYNLLNRQWNLRKETVYPRGYLLPTTAQHVAASVSCGIVYGFRLVPNSGGHSYEAISWGTNETIVVDFRSMNNISIEGSGPAAVGRIQPGALVGEINAYLWENGGYATPMGSCMTVGIGGHAFGGGVGYLAGQYGLAVDNVLEFEMVDGKGRIVVANKNQNPDLYWALRGGGPGYIGIVTNLKVKLLQADQIKITVVLLRYDLKDFVASLTGFQNMVQWIQNNEHGIGIDFKITSDSYNRTLPPLAPGILYTIVHFQDPVVQPKGNEAFLAAVSAYFPEPAQTFMYTPNYIQLLILTSYAPVLLPVANGELMPVGNLLDPALYPNSSNVAAMMPPSVSDEVELLKRVSKKSIAAPRYFKAKSLFVRRLITLAEIEKLGQVISRIPHDNIAIFSNTEMNALQIRNPSATAYIHRNAIIDITVQYEGSADPETVKEGIAYLYELWDAIQFMDSGETYQNYPDLDVKDHLIRNYGRNLHALIKQKQKWDPDNYFVNQISLPGSN